MLRKIIGSGPYSAGRHVLPRLGLARENLQAYNSPRTLVPPSLYCCETQIFLNL